MASARISRYALAFFAALALAGLTGCAWFGGTDGAAAADAPGAVSGVAQTAPPLPEPEPEPRSFTMVAVGDVMLDRGVWRLIQANGFQSILKKVREDLRSADITFANLECPLATSGPHAPSDCIFRADPRAVDVLLDGGVDVVTLANNHTLDAGVAGLMSTLDHLDRAGIAYCGAAREREAAWEPCLFEVNDVTLGFVGCTDLSFQHGSWAKVDDATTKFAERVRSAKEQCELLVVTLHWGNEYQSVPTERQRTVAHAAVEAGADLVIGHHPHTLQGIGSHHGSPILYSVGNFVFDQREGERMESAIFHLTWTEGEGWHIRAVPVWIPRSRMGPIYPDAARSAKIIERLAGLSANLGVPLSVERNEGEATIAAQDSDAVRAATDEFAHPPIRH
ncbi:MAG: CapA family protein [Armatimonadota bacterium]